MAYRLQRRQVVGGNLDQVFSFFEDPSNLEAITPSWLRFRVLGATDAKVREGTLITYRLRLLGLPVRWESRIGDYVSGQRFADEMIVGPYRRWFHRHLFRQVPEGVEILDEVDYELPLGLLGRVAHAVAVRHQLRAIFDHRERQIAALFPRSSEGGGNRGRES